MGSPFRFLESKERAMFINVLMVILLSAFIGALPTWPHSRNWGYFSAGGTALCLGVVVILLVLDRI
jgi:hypothetical protein